MDQGWPAAKRTAEAGAYKLEKGVECKEMIIYSNTHLYADKSLIILDSVDKGIAPIIGFDDNARPVLFYYAFVQFEHVSWRYGFIFAFAHELHEPMKVVQQCLTVVFLQYSEQIIVIFFNKFANDILE